MKMIKKNEKETIITRLEAMEFYIDYLANMTDNDKKDIIVKTLIHDIEKIKELIG